MNRPGTVPYALAIIAGATLWAAGAAMLASRIRRKRND